MTDRVDTHFHAAPLSSVKDAHSTHPRRALTARSSARDDDSADYVVAVIQGRGTGVEIGVAAISLSTGQTHITQIADRPTFERTIRHIFLHTPLTIVVPDTAISQGGVSFQKSDGEMESSIMVEKLEQAFDLECIPMPRSQWNRDIGIAELQRLALNDGTKAPTIMAAADKYYALSALAAVLQFLEKEQGFGFMAGSLRVSYVALEGTLFIDVDSAKNLELVKNNINHKTSNTLHGILNHCKTPMGARMLMMTILQPPNNRELIESRLDVIQEFRQSEALLGAVRQALGELSKMDVESTLGLLSRRSSHKTTGSRLTYIDSRITLLLDLRAFIRCTQRVMEALHSSQAPILGDCVKKLSYKSLLKIQEVISRNLNDDLSTNRSNKATRTRRLYAVKAHCNPMLDVARETYKENTHDIMQCADRLKERYKLELNLEWDIRGCHLSLPRDEQLSLDSSFIRVEKSKSKIHLNHPDLRQPNQRLAQSREEILLLSEKHVADMIEDLVPNLSDIWDCADAIATLDVLASLAHSSTNFPCVRPEFGEQIFIRNGRHPILERTLGNIDCIPNDTYIHPSTSPFQLIQGPNMSGKSTFLRQVGLLSIMAHVGCYVPADSATFRLHDALLTRLSNEDSMEKSLSTFAAEMATSAMVLGMATSQSLVLIDELGRGTAPQEGVGLSHAIAESLIQRKAFVLFATHFGDLAQTLNTQAGIVNLHLKTEEKALEADSPEFATTFVYKVVEGPCEVRHYGLELAKLASLPAQVMTKARETAEKLTELEIQGRSSTLAYAIAARRKTILDVYGRLRVIAGLPHSNDQVLVRKLSDLQSNSLASLRATYEAQATIEAKEGDMNEAKRIAKEDVRS